MKPLISKVGASALIITPKKIVIFTFEVSPESAPFWLTLICQILFSLPRPTPN